MLRLGIDNGQKGAIVAINGAYQAVVQEQMPMIPGDAKKLDLVMLWRILSDAKNMSGGDIYAVLEYAQVMPKQGAVSGFTIGKGYGAMQMALIALRIPHEIVRPRGWQKGVGIVTPSGVELAERKRKIKAQAIAVCQRRLPSLALVPEGKRVPHDGLADAGCMALHAVDLRPFAETFAAEPTRKAPPPVPRRTR